MTPLFRYENLEAVYSSIPKHDDIIWHISKTNKRPPLNFDFIRADSRIKVYEVECEDNDIITKRNTAFENIKNGHFHLLDDDTTFYPEMYNVYKSHIDFNGMIIGKQLSPDMSHRLSQSYPIYSYIDTGNVLCHSSILKKVKWGEREGWENKGCRDFIFWDNCFKIFGKENTKLIPEYISINNKLRP